MSHHCCSLGGEGHISTGKSHSCSVRVDRRLFGSGAACGSQNKNKDCLRGRKVPLLHKKNEALESSSTLLIFSGLVLGDSSVEPFFQMHAYVDVLVTVGSSCQSVHEGTTVAGAR